MDDLDPIFGHYAVFDVTLPVDQIKLWGADTIVTEDNTAWALDFGGTGEWYNCGPWPGGAVPTSPESWGGVKGKYDGKK